VHEIYACDAPEVIELKDASRAAVDAGLRCFHDRDPQAAVRHFREALDLHPADRGVRFLLERAEAAAEGDLPGDWDGAVSFQTK
jgi:hypothetical protein